MINSIRVFMGYDPSEAVAFYTAAHSIFKRSSKPVELHPLMLSQLQAIYKRPRIEEQSTEFSFSRYLVPYLCNYQGWALFMDCDMLFTHDIADLWALRDNRYTLQVVKHDQRPLEDIKMLGQIQTRYRRKNWTSLMLINCEKCHMLTPDYVNTADPTEIRRLLWLDEEEIGELPETWNYLTGYEDIKGYPEKVPYNIHFTLGGPWWQHYENCEYAELWLNEFSSMAHAAQLRG